jgi:hypothetical protein
MAVKCRAGTDPMECLLKDDICFASLPDRTSTNTVATLTNEQITWLQHILRELLILQTHLLQFVAPDLEQ